MYSLLLCEYLCMHVLQKLLIIKFLFQIINVYTTDYESGGKFWPIAHNSTIVSLVLTQIIALGVFGIKRSTVAFGFTIPLIFGTLLFNEYCRQRFFPTFTKMSAQVLWKFLPLYLYAFPCVFPMYEELVFDRFLQRWIDKMSRVGEWKRFINSCVLPIASSG